METVLGLLVGIGLSASCGFRIFVPMMGISIASMTGDLHLANGFEWIGTWPALTAFFFATLIEIVAYFIPWFDNLMDSIATPSAIVAGTITTASMVGDISPFLQWSLAIIAGGGSSGLVQLCSVAVRTISTATTGGLANPLIALGELILAVFLVILALTIPVLCLVVVVFIIYQMINKIISSGIILKLSEKLRA